MDGDFGAADGFAAEETDTALLELDDAIFGGMDSEIATDKGADAGTLGHADLTDDYLTGLNFLAAIKLDA